jgi:hypothetical protein
MTTARLRTARRRGLDSLSSRRGSAPQDQQLRRPGAVVVGGREQHDRARDRRCSERQGQSDEHHDQGHRLHVARQDQCAKAAEIEHEQESRQADSDRRASEQIHHKQPEKEVCAVVSHVVLHVVPHVAASILAISRRAHAPGRPLKPRLSRRSSERIDPPSYCGWPFLFSPLGLSLWVVPFFFGLVCF